MPTLLSPICISPSFFFCSVIVSRFLLLHYQLLTFNTLSVNSVNGGWLNSSGLVFKIHKKHNSVSNLFCRKILLDAIILIYPSSPGKCRRHLPDQRSAEKQLQIAKWSAYMFGHYDHKSEQINNLVRRSGRSKLVFWYSEDLCCNSTRHVGIVKHVSLLPGQYLLISKGRCWRTFPAKRDCTKTIVDRSGTGLNSFATTLADRAKCVPWQRHWIAMNASPSMPAFNQFIESF